MDETQNRRARSSPRAYRQRAPVATSAGQPSVQSVLGVELPMRNGAGDTSRGTPTKVEGMARKTHSVLR